MNKEHSIKSITDKMKDSFTSGKRPNNKNKKLSCPECTKPLQADDTFGANYYCPSCKRVWDIRLMGRRK